MVERREKIQKKLELITRRWWFFLFFIIIQFIPPYTSKSYEWSEIGVVNLEILSNSIVKAWAAWYPISKIIPIILVVSIIFLRNRVSRIFSIYVAITYVLFAFLQNISITEKYGLGVIIINLVMFNLAAIFWFWEAIIGKNDFTSPKQLCWRYWIIPFAFLAFWYPINFGKPDFNPLFLFNNVAGLTFCMMTPVYLTILILYHPKVNMVTLRVTSLVGLIIAFYNLMVNFFMDPSFLWWNGILHLPLLIISAYGLILSFRTMLSRTN
ncbi:MAG TPA: hypothetical protein PKJ95_02530 [Atribacterota bacterium]|nr:hypothetical protein [Atribacterota bacterium]